MLRYPDPAICAGLYVALGFYFADWMQERRLVRSRLQYALIVAFWPVRAFAR